MNKSGAFIRCEAQELRWLFRPSLTEILCLVAGMFFVFWYAWILDDAYVYFRYADNLVLHGNGLVWNSGEYVEGFSSPLWALLISFLRLLQLNYWTIVRAAGLLSYFAFWWLACIVNRGLSGLGSQSRPMLNIPLIYLCCTYGVACYFTSGLESPLVNVAAAAFAAAMLWPYSVGLQILVGLSPMVRHELFIPFLLFVCYAFVLKKCRPYIAIAIFAISTGGYELFRIWYYADLFPNTLYLKNGTWLLQGLLYVYDTALPYAIVPFLLCMLLGYAALARSRFGPLLGRERLAMLVLALPVAAYVVKIGGDPRHFRYLAFPFILAVLACGGLAEAFFARLTKADRRFPVLLALIFGIAAACQYPRQLQMHPAFRSIGYSHSEFNKIFDAAYHRLDEAGYTPKWGSAAQLLSAADAREKYAAAAGAGYDQAAPGVKLAAAPSDDDRMLSYFVCLVGYENPGMQIIHSLGLTEPFLARTVMQSERPAHKHGLIPLGDDLLRIRLKYGFVKGAFDRAIAAGTAPAWVLRNIDTIRRIERKAYNDHDFWTNLRLALQPTGEIDPKL